MSLQADQSQNFHPTSWTLVICAQGESPAAKAALSDLCGGYYAPVLQFLRREGRSEDAARDTAHSFFAQILEKGVGMPDKKRGRFRSYLLGALKHYLSNEHMAANREKRGGQIEHVPLNSDSAFAMPVSEPNLDLIFDRDWALTLISRSLNTLEAENAENANAALHFNTLKPWLDGRATESQAQVAARLSMSETAVKVAVHRLRCRFRELLRVEVRATVHDPSDVGDEFRHLVEIASFVGDS